MISIFPLIKITRFLLLVSTLFALSTSVGLSQAKQWDKTYGGYKNEVEDYWGISALQAMVPTPDGGYILAGDSDSDVYADKTAIRKGGNDYWIVKIDAQGKKLWDKTYGGFDFEGLETIITVPGGGYLLGGYSSSPAGADKTGSNRGNADYWIVRINESGEIIWDKTFGGKENDFLKAILPTPDGGFLLGGSSYSKAGQDKTGSSRDTSANFLHSSDFWLIKINSSGKKIWDKTLGGSAKDKLQSLAFAPDGGFLAGGSSTSGVSGEKSAARIGKSIQEDFWVVKVNETGNKLWDKTIGGTGSDVLQAIVPAGDSGYLLGGYSNSDIGGIKTAPNKGESDFWIVKINTAGTKLWDKTFGGRGDDKLKVILGAVDGSYLLGGAATSGKGLDKTEVNRGQDDYWLVKIDAFGNKNWDKTYGGVTGEGGIFGTDNGDFLNALVPGTDGGYLLGGTSDSNAGFEKSENSKGFTDFWVIKIKEELPEPTFAWDMAYGGLEAEGFTTIIKTPDNGYLLGGYSLSGNSGSKSQEGQGRNDFWIIKTDKRGHKLWDKRYGGTHHDYLNQVITTQDGGYLLAGSSLSNRGGDKTQAGRGSQDYWIIKIDKDGIKQWDRRFGGSGYDDLRKVIQLATGNFILAGFSESPADGDKSQASQGGRDYWIIKIDDSGNKIWDYRYGGNSDDNLESLVVLNTGNLLLAGSSASDISGDKTQESRGGFDYWLIQINEKGKKIWDRRFGGNGADQLFAIGQSNNGEFYLAGHSSSAANGDRKQSNRGGRDFWLVKINKSGDKLWDARFGGDRDEELRSVIPTADGGFLLGGKSFSGISGDKSQPSRGSSDYWIVKTSGSGAKLWDSRFGGNAAEELRAIIPTSEGGYLLAGRSDSGIGGDRQQANQGSTDYWLVYLTPVNHQVKPNTESNNQAQASPDLQIQESKPYSLHAYPNPFIQQIFITCTIPDTQIISLKIYDMQGQEVKVLFQGEAKAGKSNQWEWQPTHQQSSGIYLLELTTDTTTTKLKIVLQK